MMHVNYLSCNKDTYFSGLVTLFCYWVRSSFLYKADVARESELKRCRFGKVSTDFESDAL